MSKPDSNPTGASSASASTEAAVGAPDFEESVRQFWTKNRSALIAFSAIVILGILGKEGWTIIEERRADNSAAAYAAAENDDQLRNFATDHPGEPLAGAAYLRIGDTAFREERYAAAVEAYQQAAAMLGDSPLAGRIKVGEAMATLRSGDTTGGIAALTAIVNDLGAETAVRSEAAYHLVAIAAEAGDAARVDQLVTQVSAIDPASGWVQRAINLRAIYGMQGGEIDHTGHDHAEEPGVVFETP